MEHYCPCGEQTNTEHDDRKFEINGKEVCLICWVKSLIEWWSKEKKRKELK